MRHGVACMRQLIKWRTRALGGNAEDCGTSSLGCSEPGQENQQVLYQLFEDDNKAPIEEQKISDPDEEEYDRKMLDTEGFARLRKQTADRYKAKADWKRKLRTGCVKFKGKKKK